MDTIEAAGLIIPRDSGNSWYDRFRHRLMIPIRDEIGRVIGFTGRILDASQKGGKYVNSPETPVFHKNRVLFALDRARKPIADQRCAILCEGQIDAIRCHQFGFTHAVAAQGTAITDNHARILKRYCDEVILVLDPDTAGENAALRTFDVFLAHDLSVKVARLPAKEDPDSLLSSAGTPAFQAILDQAAHALDFQIDLLLEREGERNDAALMRVTRSVLQTIQQAPSAVLRDSLTNQAAKRLSISPDALQDDLRKQPAPRRTAPPAAVPAKQTPIPNHRTDETALAELLLNHDPVACELVEQYLPLDYLEDATCRYIVEQCLAQQGNDAPPVIIGDDDAPEDTRRLVAQLQMSPDKIKPEAAIQLAVTKKLIMAMWRRTLEKRRHSVRQMLPQATDEERTLLEEQHAQLTQDITTLRKDGWEASLSIMEC